MKKILKFVFIIGFILSSIGFLRISYYQVKAQTAQLLMETAWQQSLLSNNQKINKPWSWADTWPVLRIELPSINQSSLVLKDASGQSLAFGPGLMTPNLLPGQLGNSFIAAHRNTHFSQVERLKKNDKVIIVDLYGSTRSFNIDQIKIVDSRTEQPLVNTPDRRITLVTCYPFDATEANTPYRYLVSAVLEE